MPVLALGVSVAACGDDDESVPAPSARPAAPADNDPAFTVEGLGRWYLIGNDLTAGEDHLAVTVVAPAEVGAVDMWIGDQQVPARREGAALAIELDIGDLPAGDYEVVFAADGADSGFAAYTLHRSHPIYLLVTTDWDFADPSTQAMRRQDRLHAEHEDLLMTHFVGPYTFTDPAVTDVRRQALADWVKQQRDDHGDEIGLHIHPYCNFVVAAGETCITDQSTVYADGDPSGYTIKVSAYSEEQFLTLLQHADALFDEWQLGKPVTFRAGGWTASIETLRALEADGYVADTSALNWGRMEEWMGVENGELYTWNMANWSSIGDTSQPYHPNDGDVLSAAAPALGILEVPDNAIMVDYVSIDEMIDIFHANWSGGALAAPRTFMMGFHPADGFGSAEEVRVDGILDHVESYLAADDDGPVVHALLRDMPAVWP